jgi:iron complex transport system substrate-binding protein
MAALLLILPGGCGGKSDRVTIRDRAGDTVTLPAELNRVISTAPPNTEILIGLGLEDKLIAIDKYSIDVKGLPANLTLIDFSYPDGEVILGLNPDIIIAAGHNQTVSGNDPFKLIREAGIPVVYIPTSDSIDGIYGDIRFIAGLFGVQERGELIVREMKERVDKIAKTGAAIKDKRSVYFELSPAPFMVSTGRGSYLNEMISLIGAYNIFADESKWVYPSGEVIVDRNPDVIFIMEKSNKNFTVEVQKRPGFEQITAVKNGDIYMINDNLASRPSQHIVIALEQMARAVYPEFYKAE